METSFEQWWTAVKEKLNAAGCEIPDEELGDLSHMDGMGVDDFVAECIKGNQ